jgi:phage shock protein PspC (stress-responsive transcriptional regulator)
MLWGTAILAKGLRVIFEIPKKYFRLIFIVVFAWEYLVGSALGYLIDNWVMKLFTI